MNTAERAADLPPDDGALERPGHRLFTHSVLNALGQAIPAAVAVVAVPAMVRLFGTERFGLLTLSWSVIGYASLFDFGIGRALTQVVAERRETADGHELASLIWSAIAALSFIGVLVALAGILAAPRITGSALGISLPLQSEARVALRMLACGIPVVVAATAVRGVLEAHQRFDLVNLVRVPLGISMFVGPLLVAPFSVSLSWAVAALIAARVVAFVVQTIMMMRVIPTTRLRPSLHARRLAPLARFGAWMTVSNVLSPLMTQADRFIIGATLSASVVAYYTAPYEMVTRLMSAVAVAIATSLFPAFARWRDPVHARGLYRRGTFLTALGMTPLMLGVALMASPLLRLWLGPTFAEQSASVLQILSIGAIFNGLAQVPFAHIQAIGRADLTAKIHAIECPFYLLAAVSLIRSHGVNGAAIAWSLRTAVDALLLFVVSRHLLATTGRTELEAA